MTELLIDEGAQGEAPGGRQDPVVTGVHSGFLGIPAHFVASWADRRDGTIKAAWLDAAGTRIRGPLVVNDASPDEAGIERLAPTIRQCGASLVTVWLEQARGGRPQARLRLRRLDFEGGRLGAEAGAGDADSEIDAGEQPRLAPLLDGGFVVVWAQRRPGARIRAQCFGEDGARRGAAFQVDTREGLHAAPLVATLQDGSFVVGWTSDPAAPKGGELRLRLFDVEGAPLGDEIATGERGAQAIAALDNGRFVVARVKSGDPGGAEAETSAVDVTIFSADGTRAVARFPVTAERSLAASWPALAALPGGRFVVAWVQTRCDARNAGPCVRAKVFGDRQQSVGGEIAVSETVAEMRRRVSVATIFFGDAGEQVFVAWEDDATGRAAAGLCVRGCALPVLASGGLG